MIQHRCVSSPARPQPQPQPRVEIYGDQALVSRSPRSIHCVAQALPSTRASVLCCHHLLYDSLTIKNRENFSSPRGYERRLPKTHRVYLPEEQPYPSMGQGLKTTTRKDASTINDPPTEPTTPTQPKSKPSRRPYLPITGTETPPCRPHKA